MNNHRGIAVASGTRKTELEELRDEMNDRASELRGRLAIVEHELKQLRAKLDPASVKPKAPGQP